MRTYFVRIPTWAKQIYPDATWDQGHKMPILTFDDGPHPSSTPQLLQWLDGLNHKAMFFLLGEQALKFPQLTQNIRAAGHIIGNHGFKHLDGWRTSTSDYIANLEKGKDILESTLFRPAYGRLKPSQYHTLKQRNQLMMWSLMPGDFDHKVSATLVAKRIAQSQNGDIIVLHDSPSSFKKYKNIDWKPILNPINQSSIAL